jgi:hypothetical protein
MILWIWLLRGDDFLDILWLFLYILYIGSLGARVALIEV